MNHPYESFIKKPKIQPFHKWYEENISLGENENILSFLTKKTDEINKSYEGCFNLNEKIDFDNLNNNQQESLNAIVFKESFLKKLQIIENIIKSSISYGNKNIDDVMETYEDVIKEITQNNKIAVTPNSCFIYNNNVCNVKITKYKNFNELKDAINDFEKIIIYSFYVSDNLSIVVRQTNSGVLYKNELLIEKSEFRHASI